MVGRSAHAHGLGARISSVQLQVSSVQLPVRFSFLLKLHRSYGRCEFWAGYGMVQVGGAISPTTPNTMPRMRARYASPPPDLGQWV